MFSMVQAITCAEAEVTLVSPFVARVSDMTAIRLSDNQILDWYRSTLDQEFPAEDNPGVESVRNIFK